MHLITDIPLKHTKTNYITMNTRIKIISLAFAMSAAITLQAQELVRYTFTNASAAPLGLPSEGLNASDMIANGNSGFSSTANNAFINGLGNIGEPGDQYFEFTLTPDAGSFLNISKLFFDYGGESEGYSISLALRSSLDNYGVSMAEVINFESPGTGTNGTPERLVANLIEDIDFQNIATPITFRIYGWGDSRFGPLSNAQQRRIRIDNVKAEGTISPIPESAHFALVSGLLLLGFVLVFSPRR
jgi:hypothetical protein